MLRDILRDERHPRTIESSGVGDGYNDLTKEIYRVKRSAPSEKEHLNRSD